MMTSSSISAYDLLSDHPFPGIQLVTPTDHQDHGGHYCHNWVSHHHHQRDQHDQELQVGSDDKLSKQVMDVEKGIEAWDWEHKDDLYDPMIGSADIDDSDDIHDNWVPKYSSKLRVVKKMNPKRASKADSVPSVEISTDDFHYFQPENDSSSNNSGGNGNNNNGIRVCSDCNTTKTPLWRSGPKGPKSLCNACGIRQRKARKALAAASAAAAGSDNNASVTKATVSPKYLKAKTSNSKEKKTNITYQDDKQGWQQPYKKRLKHAGYTSASQDSNPSSGKDADDHQYSAGERRNTKQICFEEFITASLNKNASLHRVFPQDEKEAAILLMALSCGLVHN